VNCEKNCFEENKEAKNKYATYIKTSHTNYSMEVGISGKQTVSKHKNRFLSKLKNKRKETLHQHQMFPKE